MNDLEAPDPIGKAIEATEQKVETLTGDFRFDDGTWMKLIVPRTFNADQFETAVGVLMQLRLTAEQMKAAQSLTLPDKPRLTDVRGRPIASRID